MTIKDEYDIFPLSIEHDSLYTIWHSGIPHEGDTPHSGRYPWGSGDKGFQRPVDFYSFVRNLENKGISEVDIAKGLSMSTTKLRAFKSVSLALTYKDTINRAKQLSSMTKENGKPYTRTEIGIILGQEYYDGVPVIESQVRNLLKADDNIKRNAALNTATFLMSQVDIKGVIDVGDMVHKELNITPDKMKQALAIAEAEGYVILYGSVPQQTNPSQKTNLRLLAPKGTPKNKAYDYKEIKYITDYTSDDKGKTFREAFHYPKSLDSSRIKIRTLEEGGANKDGLIEIRRGVKDLSLGSSEYAQVRILVDNDYYMKGMAVYSDGKDMPSDIDIIFNSNKSRELPKMKHLKSIEENIKKDPSNPFGSTIKEHTGQTYYDDPNADINSSFTKVNPVTNTKQTLSPINKRAEAGDWFEWSKELPSQFLSKQPKITISKKLTETTLARQSEYESILEVTNPTVKASLLEDFADDCDKAASELKAAPFPGTRYHVILPANSIKDNEVYAPNFPEGTQVALVRFPHGGIFEIPILTVTHHNKEAEDMIGLNSRDAIVININTAHVLSGADFDGDTVLTIPANTNGIKINSIKPLLELKDFDVGEYGPDPDGIKTDKEGHDHYFRNGIEYIHISEDHKQRQMGVISNLITDMTLKGASTSDIAKAVRHSMVVIDSYKHHLDYKQSELDHDIKRLKKEYQKHDKDDKYGGAGTLISRAKNTKEINKISLGKYILTQPGNEDNGNELNLIDPYNQIYLDEKTNKKYTSKDKRTIEYDPNTGEKLYRETGEIRARIHYKDENGNKISTTAYIKDGNTYKKPKTLWQTENNDLYYKIDNDTFKKKDDSVVAIVTPIKEKRERMQIVKDARELSSGTAQEEYYAVYANSLKALANQARKDYLYFKSNPIPYNPEAKKEYKEEVKTIQAKVSLAELNAPKERAANIMAQAIVNEKLANTTERMTDEDIRKLRQNQITKARAQFGAHNSRFELTEKEWEAIQKGAFSWSYLANSILRYADKDNIRKLATPIENTKLTSSDIRRIKGLAMAGESNSSIAKRLGISISTVIKYLNGEES